MRSPVSQANSYRSGCEAAAAEAFEAEAETLLADLAAEVLGRELRIAPAELRALLARAVEAYASPERMRLRVAPDDLALLADVANVEPDPLLERGDLLVECVDGTIDLRMGTRLRQVIAAHAVSVA